MTTYEIASITLDLILVVALSFYIINHFGGPDAHA